MSLLFQIYASTSRDSLLAAVRDVLQTEVGISAPSWLLLGLFFGKGDKDPTIFVSILF